jgi:hypothetical protein
MTEDDYRKLTQVCDEILLAQGSSIERVGISWLHVLSEHPYNLTQYAELFQDKPPTWQTRLRRIAGKVLHRIRTIRDGGRWFCGDTLPKSADVLFVSHFLNEAQAASASDFYFGELPAYLESRGKNCIVALLNQSTRSPRSLSSKWLLAGTPRILLAKTVGLAGERALERHLRRESRRLISEARAAMPGFRRRALLCASFHARSMISASNLRIRQQIAELVKQIRPKAIVITYEGHAWERLAFAAARGVLPGVRCIGYHHTILFPQQHAVKRRLGFQFDPDLILTAGPVTRDQLASAAGLSGIPVGVLGTHRRMSVAQARPLDGPPTCLVIPEGLTNECIILFDFALACATLAPEVHFVLRMHPVLPFSSIAARDPRLNSLPGNVELSAASIAEDFVRCRWALYRGSSAAVHAVLAGLRAVYVSKRGEMSIDPLHELATWRCFAETPHDFVRQVNSDMQADRQTLASEAQPAIRYCEKYFTPVDATVLETAIDLE